MVEDLTSTGPARSASFLARNWQKILASLIWLALVGGFIAYSAISGRSVTDSLRDLVDLLRTPLGPPLFILIYTLRPLAFFSAIVVTLLGGAIWGPVLGTLYVVIGSNMSATLAYLFGRILGQGALPERKEGAADQGLVARYAERMRRNAFVTVLIMRLVYLPYDLVNYLAGFLRISYRSFILATALGSLPGTVTFVLAGSAVKIDDIFAGRVSPAALNPWSLLASLLLFVGGLLVARRLRGGEGQAASAEPQP